MSAGVRRVLEEGITVIRFDRSIVVPDGIAAHLLLLNKSRCEH
jgi:hypothetical protein